MINSGNTNIPGITRAFYGLGQQISSYRGREVVSHTGGVPGQTSLVVRIPSEGIAIAVLTNDGTLSGPSFFYATAMSIFDHLLDGGDTLAHWEDAMFKVAFAGSPTPLPEEPSAPPSGFDGIPGIYEGPGYGEFSLTRLERRGDDDAFYDTIFKTLQTSGVNATGPLFVAPYERTFVSHIVLTPFDDQHFNWTVTKLFKPDDKFVPGHLVSGPAVVTDDGIGFFGGFNSQGAGVKLNTPAVEDVEKRATVWFERR